MLTTDILNKNSHVGYVKSTRIKKQENTPVFEFDVNQLFKTLIKLYLKQSCPSILNLILRVMF
jgi:hypothetical protein